MAGVLIAGVIVATRLILLPRNLPQNTTPEPTVVGDISDLKFSYNGDVFNLEKTIYQGITYYSFRVTAEPQRGYTFANGTNPYSQIYTRGIIEGVDTRAFIIWRGSGANIIEPILFVFQESKGAWQQVSTTRLPDAGRTTVDKFSIENNLIELDVRTSGPDKNYHETYVPKHYTYKLINGKLVLQ